MRPFIGWTRSTLHVYTLRIYCLIFGCFARIREHMNFVYFKEKGVDFGLRSESLRQ